MPFSMSWPMAAAVMTWRAVVFSLREREEVELTGALTLTFVFEAMPNKVYPGRG